MFETNDGTQPAVLSQAIRSLRYQHKNNNFKDTYKKFGRSVNEVENELTTLTETDKEFNLELLSSQIALEAVKQDTKGIYINDIFNFNTNQYLIRKVNYKFDNTSLLNFFKNSENSLIDVINKFCAGNSGKSIYLDASKIGTTDGVGGMIVDLISNHIINLERNSIRPFVMFIDEVHRYTKGISSQGNTFYTGLNNIAREGRKKGIFLFLTTQNPNDVDKVLLGQVGTLLVHRLTSSDELKAIQNHLSEIGINHIKKLNTGEAIITSINLLKELYIKIEKCARNHNNETPSLINSK